MDSKVESEIIFYINTSFDFEVDARQLLNHVIEFEDYYQLNVYGKCLRFNKDGDLL